MLKNNKTLIKKFNKEYRNEISEEENLLLSQQIAMIHQSSITKRYNNVLSIGKSISNDHIPSIVIQNMLQDGHSLIILDEDQKIYNATKEGLMEHGYQIMTQLDDVSEITSLRMNKIALFLDASQQTADQDMRNVMDGLLLDIGYEELKEYKYRVKLIFPLDVIRKHDLHFFAEKYSLYYIMHKWDVDCLCTTDQIEDTFSLFDGNKNMAYSFFDQYVMNNGMELQKDIEERSDEYSEILQCGLEKQMDFDEKLKQIHHMKTDECAVKVRGCELMFDTVL